jgi:hypothetical protein
MKARHFSSVKHRAQGFNGDELSSFSCVGLIALSDFISEFFLTLLDDDLVDVSFILDVNDDDISTSLPFDKFTNIGFDAVSSFSRI